MPLPSQCPRGKPPGQVHVREGRGFGPETGNPQAGIARAAGAAETLPRLGWRLSPSSCSGRQLSRTDANEARPHKRSRAYTGFGSRIKRLGRRPLRYSAAGDEVDDEDDDRDDEQDVDQPAGDVESEEAEQPEDQQDDG